MSERRQATVRHYDPAAGGDLLLDDGAVVPYPADAVSGARHLARGQRVDVELADGAVTSVRLPGC